MDRLVVISVVRDFAMYKRCIAENPRLAQARLVPLDNREKNEPIPVLYNRFLDGFDFSRPAWLVFCHEDFQPLETLEPLLAQAAPDALWGPVGVRTVWRWKIDPHYQLRGRIEQCEKNGSNPRRYGEAVPLGTSAETFDCQCVIVHSSLVARHGLRFDPRFPFDLYVEDLCVAARERHGIASRVLPFACRHWSAGALSERYYAAVAAFADKWPRICCTGTSSEILGGGASRWHRFAVRLKVARRSAFLRASLAGMGWAFAGRFAVKAAQFGFSIVLARLLCPADFGLVGMVSVFLVLSTVILDGGFTAALVQKKDRTEDDFATVFWTKLAAALALYAALFPAAPAVAAFYGEPRLVAVMRAVTLGFVLAAVSSVFHARLQCARRFRALAAVSAASVLLAGAAGAALAGLGFGAWAVVGQGLAWQLLTLALLVATCRWLPRARFSPASFRAFFGFGWKHLLRSLLGVAYDSFYSVIIGRRFGAADLGHFSRADFYTAESGRIVGEVMDEVNYPLLARQQDDPVQLRHAYRNLQLLAAGVAIPALLALALFAEPLVVLLIGAKWLPCVPYLRALALGAAFAPLATLAFTTLYAKGRTDLALKAELVAKPVTFVLVLAALPFGLLAVCAAKSASSLLAFALADRAVRKTLKNAP